MRGSSRGSGATCDRSKYCRSARYGNGSFQSGNDATCRVERPRADEDGIMASRVFLDMAMSLDGFVSDADGQDGGLHDWYFAPEGESRLVLEECQNVIGAMIVGKRLSGDTPEGWDTPYEVPHFVVTHQPWKTVERHGTTFHFVDGIEPALTAARAATAGKSVCVAGG